MKPFCTVIICLVFLPATIYATHPEPESSLPGVQTGITHVGSPVEIVVKVEKPHIGGIVGYSINFASPEFEEPDWPWGGDTDAQLDYIQQHKIFLENFHQNAAYRDSIKYAALNETDVPKFFNFTFIPEVKGPMKYVAFNHHGEENGKSNSIGGFIVVEKYSKAVDQKGNCKNPELMKVMKPDYSTVVCVKHDTVSILKERGWH